jgi:chromosome segregation ATPase
MESKQGEIVALKNEKGEILAQQNEIQRSNSLKHLEILALKDKLQESRTTLLDFQNRSKEKFDEQQQELESYKTKMEEYKDETVSLKRQMQEMRVSSGRLLDLKNSTRCLQLRTNFHNSGEGQEQPHASPAATLIAWLSQNEHTGCGIRAGGRRAQIHQEIRVLTANV